MTNAISSKSNAWASYPSLTSGANLKALEAKVPDAIVLANDDALQNAIDAVLSTRFTQTVPGRTPPPAPKGFTYALTNAWSQYDGHMDLRPNRIICPAGAKTPNIHNFANVRYSELARNADWVAYELRSPEKDLCARLDEARGKPDSFERILSILEKSDQVFMTKDEGKALAYRLIATPNKTTEQIVGGR